MDRESILAIVDHTLLLQDARWEDIKEICDDGVQYKVASVCIPQCYVSRAAKYLDGKLPVCTVIGFPNGNMTTAAKVFEAKEAIENGAAEIDMVINIGELKAKNYQYLEDEIAEVRGAVGDNILKVIIETCLLTDDEKAKMCEIVFAAGGDFIKTSTGFSASGATFEDAKIFNENRPDGLLVKVAGGIASFEDAKKFIELGANRLGTSRLVKIAKAEDAGKASNSLGGY